MKSQNTLKKKVLTAVLWCAVIAALVFSALQYFGVSFDVQAGYTKTLPFQGRLTNPDGTNVTDGNYDMTFRVFDCANCESSSLWAETHTGKNAVTVEDGVFNVLLGTITAIDLDFNSGRYWLEVQVGGEVLSPRRQIGGTGYSINTDNVTGVAGSLSDTNLNSFPASERGVIDALNYLLTQINSYGLWTDTGSELRPRSGASDNVNIDGGTLTVAGATTLNSTLAVSGTISGPTNETINGIDINSGTISDATWNGNQISDSYVVALDGASQGDILYHNGTQWTQLTAGTSGRFLMTQGAGANPIWNAVSSGALADGTVDNSTLHWDDVGGSWVENTTILTTGTSVYGSGNLTLYAAGAQLILGDVGATTAIVSSDWAISSSGNMTGIGTFSSDGIMNVNDVFYVDSANGEVGINDITPDYSLDVNGNTRLIDTVDENTAFVHADNGTFSNTILTLATDEEDTGSFYFIEAIEDYDTSSDVKFSVDQDGTIVSGNSITINGTTNVISTTSNSLSVTATGATSDLTLTARGAGTALNEAGQISLSGFTNTSIIGALNELAAGSGTAGLWLDHAADYLYPNSTYSDNVSIHSGVLGVGITPVAGTAINVRNSGAGFGVDVEMTAGTGGVYGLRVLTSGSTGVDIGVLSLISNASGGIDYAGHFGISTSGSGDNYGIRSYIDDGSLAGNNYALAGAVVAGTTNSDYAGHFSINDGNGGNDYVIYADPVSDVDYGLYVAGGATSYAGYFDGSVYASGNFVSGSTITINGTANTISGSTGLSLNTSAAGDLLFSDDNATNIPLTVSDSAINAGLGQGIIDAINDLATGVGGMWLDNAADYLYPNSTYSDNVGITSGVLGVGVAPNSSYAIYSYTNASNGRGVFGSADVSDSTNYGVYGHARGNKSEEATVHHGVFGTAGGVNTTSYGGKFEASATGEEGTNYGIFAAGSGGGTNWAGYFDSGDVYIANDLGIGVSPSYELHVAGDGYITSGLGVGVAQTTTGYIQANSRIGVGVSPSYPLHVSGDGYITSGLGVGTAQTNDGYIQANQRIGVGVSPSYRAHIYDHSTNLRYGLYSDFRSTYSADDQAAIYGYNTTVNGSAAIALSGIEGGSSGAGTAGWNTGVYGWAEDNTNQSIGVWGEARDGSGLAAGGYFNVRSDATGDQYAVYADIVAGNDGKVNRVVEALVAIGADAYTTWPDDSVAGVNAQVNMEGSVNYGNNVPEVRGSSSGLYLASGNTIQNTGGLGMNAASGTIYADGTFSNSADVTGVYGVVGGGATGVYQDSSTWLRGVVGAIEATHWGGSHPTYTGVNAAGIYSETRNTNSTGTNYAFYGEVGGGQQNYGAFLDVMTGGSGTDYGLRIDIGSNVEYGAYIDSGATTDELYVNGTATFTGNISAPNKGAAVSDVVKNDSGEVLHEGDVVVLSGADAVNYLFDGKIPVPKIRKSQGEQDGGKLFGVMYQSHKGERYDIQPNEYGFAFTMNAIRKVNVSGENGNIAVGDKLSLSSISGHAKKADPGENTLGLALKSHNSSGTGQIPVFVQLGYNNQTVAEGDGGKIEAGEVSGDLGIKGSLAVSGDVDIKGTLKASSIWSQNATWHIDSQGELFVQKVQTQELEIAEGDNKSIGGVDILAGNSEVLVTNTSVTADSRIFLTVEGESDLDSGVKLKEKRVGEGFVIATGDGEPVTADVEINWLIIN